MLINSKAVSLLLGISIAVVTTAFLSLVRDITNTALLVAFILSFSSAYILIKITLDFLIFREIHKIYAALDKLKKKDLSFLEKSSENKFVNPLKRINQEIYTYATVKQQEINDLKELAAFRREFVANISHELKTPIFAAQGFVHTLLDGAIEDKKIRYKFLKKAAKSLDGLDRLVHELLTLSQMETGEIKMHYEHFNILNTIKEVYEQFEEEAGKKNIILLVKHPENLTKIYVYADSNRILQVLTNLVSNAIKYTRKGGNVETIVDISEKEIFIAVKDQGKGIPPEDLDRIFERFYRVEKSRSRDKGGTGLGLAIVKHIMEAHGTQVEVNSKVGEGSTFSFRLSRGEASQLYAALAESKINNP